MRPHPAAQAFPAPAKLNLDLRIIGRRPDGYHLLESIFCLINLCDTVWLLPRHDGQILLHTPTPGISAEQDLSYRAARLLQQFSGSPGGVEIWLEKRIPTGGGLGGGSSDAATVLLALNHMWHTGIPPIQLRRIGLSLGADVPFFLFGRNAFAQGIGEILNPIDVPEQWYVLVRPNVRISTPTVFSHPQLPRNSPSCPNPSFEQLQPFRNDMQAVVLAEYPPVAAAFRLLQSHGKPQLTGSGACLFVACSTQEEAVFIRSRLPENLESWCIGGLHNHPLLKFLNK